MGQPRVFRGCAATGPSGGDVTRDMACRRVFSQPLFGRHSADGVGGLPDPFGFGGSPFGDLFETFFSGGGSTGRRQRQVPRGGDIKATISLAFEEAVFQDRFAEAGGYIERMNDKNAAEYGDRLRLVQGTFSDLDALAGEPVDGVVLDLGVSSMQLDQADRGFSFLRDGPLDMRMGDDGPSAADLLNSAEEAQIADVLYHYGEERAARRIARAIVAARPLSRTSELAEIVADIIAEKRAAQARPWV